MGGGGAGCASALWLIAASTVRVMPSRSMRMRPVIGWKGEAIALVMFVAPSVVPVSGNEQMVTGRRVASLAAG